MLQKIIIAALLLGVIGGIFGYKMYNKTHEQMTQASTDFRLTATELFSTFEADEAQANNKFLDKIIEVSGTVASVSEKPEEGLMVSLDGGGMMGGVLCKMENNEETVKSDLKIGEPVMLKGQCTGMLMDVVLVRCVQI